jgi:CRP/FNR family transcriptional regulator
MKSFKEIQKIQEYATRHPSFIEELDDPERQKITEKMMAFSYRKGEAIFSEGEPADSLYVIRKGNVKLCTYDGEGREQIISIFSAGDTLWVSVFLRKSLSTYPYSAVCMDEAVISQIRREDFESLIKDTESAIQIIGLLSNKLHDANERNLILSISDPTAKIARLFLYRLNHISGNIVSMKLEDIAGHVSLRPETVSRKLGELMDQRVIEKVGQSSFKIIDYEKLVQISQN